MGEVLTGLTAAIENNNIYLSWNWEQAHVMADVVCEWNGTRGNIYRDEYIAWGNRYKYVQEPGDYGLLSFRIIPYREGNVPVEIESGGVVSIMGRPREILYSVSEKKQALSAYKYVYFNIKCGAEIQKGALCYKKHGIPLIYAISDTVTAGVHKFGPVIVRKNEGVALCVREKFEGIYRLKEMI